MIITRWYQFFQFFDNYNSYENLNKIKVVAYSLLLFRDRGLQTMYAYHAAYLLTFFEKFFSQKIVLINRLAIDIRITNLVPTINIFYLLLLRLPRRRRKILGLSLYSLLFLLLSVFISKDLVLFKNFFTPLWKRVSFKRHKKLLYLLRYIFRILIPWLIDRGVLKGFSFYISGKIGLSGSVKTKSLSLKYGICGASQKFLKFKQEIFPVDTKSGALGLRCILVY